MAIDGHGILAVLHDRVVIIFFSACVNNVGLILMEVVKQRLIGIFLMNNDKVVAIWAILLMR